MFVFLNGVITFVLFPFGYLVAFEYRYQVPCEIPQFLRGLYLCFTAHSQCIYYNLFRPQLPVWSKWNSFITMTHVRNISVSASFVMCMLCPLSNIATF